MLGACIVLLFREDMNIEIAATHFATTGPPTLHSTHRDKTAAFFDVSLLTIDDVIFDYRERNVQRKKCARKRQPPLTRLTAKHLFPLLLFTAFIVSY